MKIKRYVIVAAAMVALWGGAVAAGVDDDISGVVGRQNKIYFDNQPIPIYDYSAQRDLVIQLYNITIPNMPNTWTVMYEFGVPTDVCMSKGYGIPFGVSLTNPEYMKTDGNGGDSATSVDLPQPEPTGLYTNDLSTSATWVICVNPTNGLVEPVYVEGNVRTYSHPVTIEGGQIVHDWTNTSVWLDMSKASN